MVAGSVGQGPGRPDRKAAKESKALAQTNPQYQAAVEKVRALQVQVAAEAAKIRSLTQALQGSAAGAQRQLLAGDLARTNARLQSLQDQLHDADAGLTSTLQKQSIQVGGGTVPGAVVVGVGAAFCFTLLLIILSRRRRHVRRR